MRNGLVFLLTLLLATPAPAGRSDEDEAEKAYQAARRSYYALKDDAQRRKFRHNWLNVARKFEAVAKKYPKTERAPDALFTAAELQRDLSRISRLDEDLQAAMAAYQKLIDEYPRDNLSDDAALALGQIYVDRLGDTERARRVLEHALGRLPRGDLHGKLVALQRTLPAKPEPRATGKRIAARTPDIEEVETPKPVKPEPAPAQAQASTSNTDAPASPAPSADPLLEAIARVARPAETPSSADGPVSREEKKSPEVASAPKQEAGSRKESGANQASRSRQVSAKEVKARLDAAVKSSDEMTLAEQLGLKVRRVVIDAGHGGRDTGAVGKKGTREKDVALAIAKRVGEILADRGLEVILTRDDDTFVPLEDRTRIANEAKGDLFISIHCNASENRKVRGVETFTLNVAADRYSIRLAARENASSEKSISDLQFILADLATKANTEESERLASRVQRSIVTSLREKYEDIKDYGTKQALFYVLLGAKMPAILVETSFISNPEEEERLASKAYQERLAVAIADGVQGFLEDRQKVAQVD